MSDWVRFDDSDGLAISGYIQGYEAKPTTLIAYYIRHKSDILIPTVGDFMGKYEHLKNNYGIYFLMGDERSSGGKKTIYIGQASEREDTKGMDRLKEHMNKNNPDKYIDRWESALYITNYENDWSSGVLNTLEKLLIAVFKVHSNYTCLNTQDGRNGNVPEQDYRTILKYILDILAMPVFGYALSDVQKIQLKENIKSMISEMLLTVREQEEKSVRAELLEKYSREDIEHLSWSRKVEIYDNFKLNLVDAHKYIYGERIPFGSGVDEITTKAETAHDMVALIPAEQFSSKTKMIDIYSKSGIFLICLLERFMSDDPALPINHEPEFVDKRKRLNHVIQHQLYGICGTLPLFLLSNKYFIDTIEGYIDTIYKDKKLIRDSNVILPNIICIDGFRNIVKNSPAEGIIPIIRERFKDKQTVRDEDMKFDVVIGNPPYNNDIYLDFVQLGHKLSSNYTCMITPAKWQAKTDGKPKSSKSSTPDKNEEFRKSIVPYMSKIVVYKDTKDIFDIGEPGGISYFVTDKDRHNIKYVKTMCKRNKLLESDEFEPHDETNVTLYNHKILSIIGKVGTLGEGFKQSLYVKNTDHGEITIDAALGFKRFTFTAEQERGESKPQGPVKGVDYVDVMQGEKLVGYKAVNDLFTTVGLTKYKCIQSCMPVQGSNDPFGKDDGLTLGSNLIMVIGPNQVPKGSFQVLKYFDTYEEALNFKRYLNSRTMSLMQFLGLCGATMTKEFFRFIPDPKDWTLIYEDAPLSGYTPDENGIYTDNDGNKHCSLYAKYDLTPEEINIIESVIKERK